MEQKQIDAAAKEYGHKSIKTKGKIEWVQPQIGDMATRFKAGALWALNNLKIKSEQP